jgi:hypothetical protein
LERKERKHSPRTGSKRKRACPQVEDTINEDGVERGAIVRTLCRGCLIKGTICRGIKRKQKETKR